MPTHTEPVLLITGGAGYVGRALVRELRAPAAALRPAEVRVLDLGPDAPPELASVTYLQGDVRDRAALDRACAGVDIVLHLAAVIDWGQHPAAFVREVNLDGTRRVIDACRAAGVRGLVFASSLDAVFGGQPIHDADESLPYPAHFSGEYCASKAAAEMAVLRADGWPTSAGPLRTIVLRPCAVWGEDDPYHVAPVVGLARRGPVVRLGRQRTPTQWVYVGNMAHALAVAARALVDGRSEAAGQLYFVTDFAARNFFDQMEPLVEAVGGRVLPPALALPHGPMKALSYVLTAAARHLGVTPLLTPFSVDHLCHEFTVCSDKAARLLGYQPIYSEREAYARTIAALVRSGGCDA